MIPAFAWESAALFFGPVVSSEFTRLRDNYAQALALRQVEPPPSTQPSERGWPAIEVTADDLQAERNANALGACR